METKTDAQSEMMKTLGMAASGRGRKKWKWIIALVLLVLVVAGVMAFGKKKDVKAEVYFKTEAVQRGPLTVTVSATGSLEPTNSVDVGSEQSGIVESVEVTYNDRVETGQVLARLDPSRLEAQVTQSKAGLESAKAQLLQSQAAVTEARNRMSRLKDVWERSGNKVPSLEVLEVAETTLQKALASEAAAKAQVSVARANLEAFETDFSKLIIYSPVNGIVLSRDVEPGQTVQASFQAVTLFKLAEDLTRMELHVAVDEADVGQVREGQKATFTVDAYPDRTFDADVLQVRYGANTEQGVVTYETVLSVDNSELLLRPGMTATAEIVVNEISDVLLISNSALRFSPDPKDLVRFTEKAKPGNEPPPVAAAGEPPSEAAAINQQMVWAIRDGKMVQVPIVIGETDLDHTEVKEGELSPGDLLIINTGGTGGGSVTIGVG
jgi:HlyD family secretion protein